MDMVTAAERVIQEAQRQLAKGEWEPVTGDLALARETAAALAVAVGPTDVQEKLPRIDRLAGLREALAALAVTVARTHGHLAWFLADASSHLAPVLHWRVQDGPAGSSFGAVPPADSDLADAEAAIRLLAAALTRTGQGT
ncbi:hypothetical protein ACIRVF_42185 [Kitasatospora sp. NPDC101157]|uniref:hypothetical protein n=1 Tax=Kitasatospora sp. NPDC101157 TaxID=3364098 RepID=UPI00381E8470